MDDHQIILGLLTRYHVDTLIALIKEVRATLDPLPAPTRFACPTVPEAYPAEPNALYYPTTSNPAPLLQPVPSRSDDSMLSNLLPSNTNISQLQGHDVANHSSSNPEVAGKGLSRGSSAASSLAPSITKGNKVWSGDCPFCWEYGISATASRKADLKRHFKTFHKNEHQWACPMPQHECGKVFGWKSALENHLKEAHPECQAEKTQRKLCGQVVFACGFESCKHVCEARCDEDAERVVEDYFEHVLQHYGQGLTHHDWSYTVRFRNLMRQSLVATVWKQREKKDTSSLVWHPQTTYTLRKLLESRHLEDIPALVKCAVELGSPSFSNPDIIIPPPNPLRLPLQENCLSALSGHKPGVIPEVALPQQVGPHITRSGTLGGYGVSGAIQFQMPNATTGISGNLLWQTNPHAQLLCHRPPPGVNFPNSASSDPAFQPPSGDNSSFSSWTMNNILGPFARNPNYAPFQPGTPTMRPGGLAETHPGQSRRPNANHNQNQYPNHAGNGFMH